jgi:transposase-like protein
MKPERQQRTYDHRLVRLVLETGDMTIATRLGVPRSTAAGWIRRAPRPVVAVPGHDASTAELRGRVARLEKRARRLTACLRVLLALVRILKADLKRLRIPRAGDKSRLLRAIDRSRGVLGLGRILRILGLSPSRLNAWRRRPANSRTNPPVPTPRPTG